MPTLTNGISDYGAAWQEHDDTARLALLIRCFAIDGRYVDPTADVSGRDALSKHIGEVLDSSKGRVELTSKPVSHHNVVHFTWHMIDADGAEMVAGHDFIQLGEDGKIASLSGFFGDPQPLG